MYAKKLGVIFVFSVCLIIIGSGVATAKPINPLDYFAPGEIGATSDTVTGQWIYLYTLGGSGTFAVKLTGSEDETGEHRLYSIVDEEAPFLQCDIGRRKKTIKDARVGEIFDIWMGADLTPSVMKTDTPILVDGTDYVCYLLLHRGTFTYANTYAKSRLTLVVLDKLQAPVPCTHEEVGLDPNNPDHYGRVVYYANFVKNVGLIEYFKPDYTEYDGEQCNKITWEIYKLKSVNFFP